jgi:phosphoribosylamine-glycine ligase
MKFLFRSGWGESLALARRVEAEGNLVRFSVSEPTAQTVGQGLIPKTKDFLGSVGWADVVVFDSNDFELPNEAQRLRDHGKAVFGSGDFSAKLEEERILAADIAKKAGIEVPEFVSFTGPAAWNKAKKFLAERDEDEGWVWKHNGDSETASTYVASSVPEMVRLLDWIAGLYVKEKEQPDFILSSKVEGVEVSTEAWFNGTDFVLANNTIERNRFFNGDLGEKTGCAGNVVWTYGDVDSCPLYEKLLAPLAKVFKGKYNGPVDVNAIIEKESNEPIFLEFTPRLGYDAIYAFAHCITSDLAGLLADIAMGRKWKGEFKSDRYFGALRIHVPPYPEEEKGRAEGVPVFGFDPETVRKSVSPGEIRLDANGNPEISGPNGCAFILSADGGTPKEVMLKCEPDKLLKVPMMRYRTDLPDLLQEIFDDLCATEWVKGPARQVFGRVDAIEDVVGEKGDVHE